MSTNVAWLIIRKKGQCTQGTVSKGLGETRSHVSKGLVGPGKKLSVGKPPEGFKLWRDIQKMTHAL